MKKEVKTPRQYYLLLSTSPLNFVPIVKDHEHNINVRYVADLRQWEGDVFTSFSGQHLTCDITQHILKQKVALWPCKTMTTVNICKLFGKFSRNLSKNVDILNYCALHMKRPLLRCLCQELHTVALFKKIETYDYSVPIRVWGHYGVCPNSNHKRGASDPLNSIMFLNGSAPPLYMIYCSFRFFTLAHGVSTINVEDWIGATCKMNFFSQDVSPPCFL